MLNAEWLNAEWLNLELWSLLPADSTVDEVARDFFLRQPVLWLD